MPLQGRNENDEEDSCESNSIKNEVKPSKGKTIKKEGGDKKMNMNMNMNMINQDGMNSLNQNNKNQNIIQGNNPSFISPMFINPNQMKFDNQSFPFNPNSQSNLTTINTLNSNMMNSTENYNPMLRNMISFDEHDKHNLSQDSNEDHLKNNDFHENNENRKEEVFPHHSLFTSEDLKEMGLFNSSSQSQMKGALTTRSNNFLIGQQERESLEDDLKNLNLEEKDIRSYLSNSKHDNILSNFNNKEENSKNKLNASAKGFIPKSNIK